VTHVRATTKITPLRHRMFLTEREGTKFVRTYRNGYYTDEVGLTEECLQQNIVSFMFVENTLLNATIKLLLKQQQQQKHSPSFMKSRPQVTLNRTTIHIHIDNILWRTRNQLDPTSAMHCAYRNTDTICYVWLLPSIKRVNKYSVIKAKLIINILFVLTLTIIVIVVFTYRSTLP